MQALKSNGAAKEKGARKSLSAAKLREEKKGTTGLRDRETKKAKLAQIEEMERKLREAERELGTDENGDETEKLEQSVKHKVGRIMLIRLCQRLIQRGGQAAVESARASRTKPTTLSKMMHSSSNRNDAKRPQRNQVQEPLHVSVLALHSMPNGVEHGERYKKDMRLVSKESYRAPRHVICAACEHVKTKGYMCFHPTDDDDDPDAADQAKTRPRCEHCFESLISKTGRRMVNCHHRISRKRQRNYDVSFVSTVDCHISRAVKEMVEDTKDRRAVQGALATFLKVKFTPF